MIKNVLAGLPEEATKFLIDHSKDLLTKRVFDRVGPIGALELYEYDLLDGTLAKEFVQTIIESNSKQNIYFVGLRVGTHTFTWKSIEISEYILTKN